MDTALIIILTILLTLFFTFSLALLYAVHTLSNKVTELKEALSKEKKKSDVRRLQK